MFPSLISVKLKYNMALSFRTVVGVALFQMITKISNAGHVNSTYPRGLHGINPDSSDLLSNIEYSPPLSSPSSLPNLVSTTAYFNASEPLSNSILTQPLTATSLLSSISTSTPEQPSTTLRLPSRIVDTLAMSSAPSSLPLMSTNLTPSTSPISVSLKLASLSITPSTSSGYNLVTSPSSNSTQALSPSSTSLESTSLDPTLIITSPFNAQSSAPILYTSELLEPLCTTPTPVLSTHLYLSKLTLNIDRPTVPTALYLPSSFPTPASSPESSSVPLLNSIPSSELTPVPESALLSMSEESIPKYKFTRTCI